MLTRLTKKQQAMLPVWRDKWIEIGLSCEPCDFEKAKVACQAVYKAARLPSPSLYFVADSPIGGAMMAMVWSQVGEQVRSQVGSQVESQVGSQVESQVGSQVESQVRSQVRSQVWSQVRSQVRSQVGSQVESQVRSQVGSQVESQVRSQVRSQVWSQVRSQVWEQVGEQVWEQIYGAHDAYWLSYYSYFRDVCGLECCQPLSGLMDMAKHCGWWSPYRHLVIFQHRHRELHRDERGRLHNPHGAAVLYRDGWGVYAVHGVRVPEALIREPETNTIAAIEQETNAEIRRIRIELYGFGRYLHDAKIACVQQDDFGKLYKREMSDNEPALAFVEVVNSTPEPDGTHKKYILPCRSTVRSAHEAVAQSFGLEVASYSPEFES